MTLTVARVGGGTGTVTSNPAGLNCGTTCTLTVSSGTVVTLTAAPAPNTTLTDWGGACPAGTATCAVTVNANQTVTATFNPSSANPSLSVVFAGTGAGSVTCNGGACNASYPWGTSITVAGVPNGNSSFAGWSGGGCTGTAPCTVLLWADTALTATFNLLPVTAQLSVSKAGSGGGTVTSVPAGITCGATCASNFPGGTVVTLTATAATGSTFAGWSGGGCAGTGTCVVTLNANAAVTATFNTIPPTVTLTTAINGTGTGTVTCNGGACQPSYPSGTALTIVATPAVTSLFAGWSGACAASGTATACALTITANSTVSATFNLPTLSVVVAGTGTVTSNPAGINCGATCTASFNKNTAVTLTATGANFSGWSGGGCSGTGSCQITLTQNTTVTATFGVVSSGANIFVSTGATTGTYVDPRIIDDGSGGTIIVWHSSEFTHRLQAQRYNAAGIPQWGANGIVVCCTMNITGISDLRVTTDGAGGVIVVWTDWRRYPSPTDVFAQRINSAGVIQWGSNGLPIAASDEIEDDPQIISDGAGGGIIAYHRQTQGCGTGCAGAYVQRVTSAGVTQWTSNGVLLSARSGPVDRAAHARLASDGSGGAIVAWHDSALLSGSQIFAQRVNAVGVPQWAASGIAITDYPTDSFGPTGGGGYPEVAIDGSGGAIIVWKGGDRTSGSGIRGQRVTSNGVQQWITNGIIIYSFTSSTIVTGLQVVSDGVNGALLAWSDNRNGSDSDVYAQRVTGAGGIAWAADGIAVGAGLGSQEFRTDDQLPPTITPDGAGGVIIVWQDSRSISGFDIYAQHLNANGNAQWAANGLAISTALNDQTYPVITTDGSGGAWMAWMDKRNDPGNFTADIYAQHVTNAGTLP